MGFGAGWKGLYSAACSLAGQINLFCCAGGSLSCQVFIPIGLQIQLIARSPRCSE